jgi:hypothetical protein
VAIHPAGFVTPRTRPPGIATGFSAGVDSFCVLADHYFVEGPAESRPTHLLFNNVGSHGRDGTALFRERHARVAATAKEIGLPLIGVDSNVDAFYGEGIGFQQTHTMRNASVALLLQGGLGQFLSASTYAIQDAQIGRWHDMGRSDFVALPMLQTETLGMQSSGAAHTRVEKTLLVARLPVSHRHLDVCARGERAGNCSTCIKCARTLLTLTVGGVEDRFAPVFDLAAYRRLHPRFCGKVLRSRNLLNREILAFAAEQGFRFPLWAYATSPLGGISYLVRRAAGRLRRKPKETPWPSFRTSRPNR